MYLVVSSSFISVIAAPTVLGPDMAINVAEYRPTRNPKSSSYYFVAHIQTGS